MSKFYPVVLKLENRPVLVIGGGKVAERKVKALLECGAKVYIVSKGFTSGLKRLVDEKRVIFLGEDFLPEYLDKKLFVILATDNREFNSQVARIAREKGIMVNVVDQPSECDFILPSVIRRGDLIIAVSTSGKSPAFSKAMREELESIYGTEYGILLDIASSLRNFLIRTGVQDKKNEIFKKLWDSDMINRIKNNDVAGMVQIVGELSRYL